MQPWVPTILASAVLLALYDLSKKHGVRGNAVMPVLFFATLSGAVAFTLYMAFAGRLGGALHVAPGTCLLLLLKALIVGGSWTFAYFAVRALPISLSAPLRASAPFWTILGALVVYQEVPTLLQAAGMAAILGGYVLFSRTERAEGIDFWHNRGVWCSFAGTLLGAASALYDKYLLQVREIPRETVQTWFCLGLVAVTGFFWLVLRRTGVARDKFTWRWTVPLIGVLLVASDYLYFAAVASPGAPISILSLLRRSSVVITFTAGAYLFHEGNLRGKTIALAAILLGVVLICWH